MIKEIPKRYEYECDRCTKRWSDSDQYTEACGLSLKGTTWGKSPGGDIGRGYVAYDFCGDCTRSFFEWKQGGVK